jgi:hypothetical protein
MPTLDSFGRDYLRLVLAIDRHIDGYIDAYYGPPELKAESMEGPPQPPDRLLAGVSALQERIPAWDPDRAAYLVSLLRAVEGTVRMLAGESLQFEDEVATLYDIRPALVDEATFTAAHRTLDTLLPVIDGASLNDRLQAFRKMFEISPADAMPLLEIARKETRRRTAMLIDLPLDESIQLELVSNQPWSAYNWYMGEGHSLIEFNTDIPLNTLHLLGTFAHEGYPGHHTEAILKEKGLYEANGYAEQAAALLHSPAAVISEGIATTALDMIFPDQSHIDWNLGEIVARAPLSAEARRTSAATIRAINEAAGALRYVNNNASILHSAGRLDREQTLDYLMTFGLATRERAEKSFSFMTHPLYRSYGFTYTHGHDLIDATADPKATFLRCLTHQVRPSELAAGQLDG